MGLLGVVLILAAAYGLSTNQGWVHLLGERAASLGWRVVNASISGETTAGGLRRLPGDLKRHRPAVVVIALGANDALRGQPIAAIRGNLDVAPFPPSRSFWFSIDLGL